MIKSLWLKFLRPFYLKSIIANLTQLVAPFYIIYFLNIWLNLWQIALISSFRSIVSLISEIPTWTIADLYGKKLSVILWFIRSWITVLFIPFFHSFMWICIIFCINALAETLFSGSNQAWVSDVIEKNDSMNIGKFSRKKSLIRLAPIYLLTVNYYSRDNPLFRRKLKRLIWRTVRRLDEKRFLASYKGNI